MLYLSRPRPLFWECPYRGNLTSTKNTEKGTVV